MIYLQGFVVLNRKKHRCRRNSSAEFIASTQRRLCTYEQEPAARRHAWRAGAIVEHRRTHSDRECGDQCDEFDAARQTLDEKRRTPQITNQITQQITEQITEQITYKVAASTSLRREPGRHEHRRTRQHSQSDRALETARARTARHLRINRLACERQSCAVAPTYWRRHRQPADSVGASGAASNTRQSFAVVVASLEQVWFAAFVRSTHCATSGLDIATFQQQSKFSKVFFFFIMLEKFVLCCCVCFS